MAILSGFPALDTVTGGFKDSELVIVAARPAEGRFSFALSMAAHMAIQDRRPVGFCSLEVSGSQVLKRLVVGGGGSCDDGSDPEHLTPVEFSSFMDSAGRIHDSPFFLFDTPNLGLTEIEAQARRLSAEEGVEIIFIDCLSLMVPSGPGLEAKDHYECSARSLKGLARELSIPIVVTAQLKRGPRTVVPAIGDLGEAIGLERHSDLIILLHRTGSAKRDDGKPIMENTSLLVVKHRNGPVAAMEIALPE